MSTVNALIIIAKYPEIGRVKTRLSGDLTDEQRLKLYMFLLTNTMSRLGSIGGVDTFIAFAPVERRAFFEAYGLRLLPLPPGDLGERMFYAFKEVFRKGYKKAALVGVDIPDLTPRIVTKAFELMNENDVVFGPARDGGYYLVGMKKPLQELFTDIPWSSDTTLDRSVQRGRYAGRAVGFTETLSDIDTIEDVKKAGFHL